MHYFDRYLFVSSLCYYMSFPPKPNSFGDLSRKLFFENIPNYDFDRNIHTSDFRDFWYITVFWPTESESEVWFAIDLIFCFYSGLRVTKLHYTTDDVTAKNLNTNWRGEIAEVPSITGLYSVLKNSRTKLRNSPNSWQKLSIYHLELCLHVLKDFFFIWSLEKYVNIV